jgi:hypothetical protein
MSPSRVTSWRDYPTCLCNNWTYFCIWLADCVIKGGNWQVPANANLAHKTWLTLAALLHTSMFATVVRSEIGILIGEEEFFKRRNWGSGATPRAAARLTWSRPPRCPQLYPAILSPPQTDDAPSYACGARRFTFISAYSVIAQLRPTDAATHTALFLICRRLPYLLLFPVTGLAADRLNRGALLVAVCLVEGAVSFTLPLVQQRQDIWYALHRGRLRDDAAANTSQCPLFHTNSVCSSTHARTVVQRLIPADPGPVSYLLLADCT